VANFVFNITKGRVAELCNRVDTADPTNAVLVVVLLAATNLETQTTLQDKVSFADLVSGTTRESTNSGYARKVLTGAAIGPFAPDQVNDLFQITIPNQTWTAVQNDGTGAIGALVVGYQRDSTSPGDANILPLTHHTFAVTPDGADITAQIGTSGIYQAS